MELAQNGSCVIVGRCADYILKNSADCLTVFIHADMKKRMERIVTQYGEHTEFLEKRIKDMDKKRAVYHQIYADSEWGVAKNYDIALDSGVIGIEKCTEIIASLY